MQVRGDVRCGGMVGMVVRVTVGRWCGDGERERYDRPFGREYQRILDHGTRPSILICILRRFDAVVLCKCGHGSVSRLVVLDHVDGGLECLVMHVRRKGRGVVEPDQNANVEELVFVDSKVIQDGALRGKGERRAARCEIKRGNEFVHSGIEQRIGWTIDGMDI